MEVDKLAMLSADIAAGTLAPRTVNNYAYIVALKANYLFDPNNPVRHLRHPLTSNRMFFESLLTFTQAKWIIL